MNDEQKQKIAKAKERAKENKVDKELIDKAGSILWNEFLTDFNKHLDELRARSIIESEARKEYSELLSRGLEKLAETIETNRVELTPLIDMLAELKQQNTLEYESTTGFYTDFSTTLSNIDKEVKVEPEITVEDNSMDKYKPADSSKKHHGYLANDGSWYIMLVESKRNHQKFRYATGRGDFAKNWKHRHQLEYKRLDKVEL